MGLDMYLERMPRYGTTTPEEVKDIESYFNWKNSKGAANYTLKDWCGVDIKDLPSEQVIDFYKQFCNAKYYYWDDEHEYSHNMIFENIGYWRKANHIHNWFVEHVQNGIDDCEYHNEVTKEILEELLKTCQTVLDNSELINGKIENGARIENGKWVPIMEDGKYIKDSSVAEELLPTQSGFFFGSTDYDEWYLNDIKETIKICKNALATTDFDKQAIYYCSSW